MTKYTNVHVTCSTNTRSDIDRFVQLFRETIDPDVKVDVTEQKSSMETDEGTLQVVYYSGVLSMLAETSTLSDTMDNIPMLFKTVTDPDMKDIHPHVNDDWSVSVFLDERPNGLQLHESTMYLYRNAQEMAKLNTVLENQNMLLHKKIIETDAKLESIEESYRGLMAFLHTGINIKQMHEIVIQTANAVDPEILERGQLKRFVYQ